MRAKFSQDALAERVNAFEDAWKAMRNSLSDCSCPSAEVEQAFKDSRQQLLDFLDLFKADKDALLPEPAPEGVGACRGRVSLIDNKLLQLRSKPMHVTA
jgi:hypothetical protein